MLSKHDRYHGLGMDALVTVCSRNTNAILVSAWMHWQPLTLETQTLLWFGHGCTGRSMMVSENNHENKLKNKPKSPGASRTRHQVLMTELISLLMPGVTDSSSVRGIYQ